MTRTAVVLGTSAGAVLVHALNGFFGWGWLAPTLFAVLMNIVFLGHMLVTRDVTLAKRALVGLVSGCLVLLSDWVCIHYGGLRYEAGGPFVFLSPLYIPFSFIGAVVQLGELYEHGQRRAGFAVALSLTALAGLLYIPLFEYFAKTGRLWHYDGVPTFLDTVPYYIVSGEVVIGAGIGLATHTIATRSWAFAMLAGLVLGLAIIGSMFAGCLLFGAT